MAGLKIRWGGATVSPSQVKVRSGGAWADPAAVWVRASGAWVKVWPSASGPTVAMPNVVDYKERSSGSVTAGISIVPDGSFTTIGGHGVGPNSGSWLTSGSSSDVQVYATYSGGLGASWSGTFGSWVSPGGLWSITRSADGTSTGVISLVFRDKTTHAILDSADIDVSVYRGYIP